MEMTQADNCEPPDWANRFRPGPERGPNTKSRCKHTACPKTLAPSHMLAPKQNPGATTHACAKNSVQAHMLAQKNGASTHACAKSLAQAHMLAPTALRKHTCLRQTPCASTHACAKSFVQAHMLAPHASCKHTCLHQNPLASTHPAVRGGWCSSGKYLPTGGGVGAKHAHVVVLAPTPAASAML